MAPKKKPVFTPVHELKLNYREFKIFREIVYEEMEKRGFNFQDLADELGVARKSLFNWAYTTVDTNGYRKGCKPPSKFLSAKLANYFKIERSRYKRLTFFTDYKAWAVLIVFGGMVALTLTACKKEEPKETYHYTMTEDMRKKQNEEIFGVDPETDFVPGFYENVYTVYDDIPLSTEQQLYVQDLCDKYSICPELIYTIMFFESTYDTKAVNGSCKGIMQINTACHEIENPFDFYENVKVGVEYLADLFNQHEEVDLVLGIWHGESKAFENYEKGEVSKYVEKVLYHSAELERKHGK